MHYFGNSPGPSSFCYQSVIRECYQCSTQGSLAPMGGLWSTPAPGTMPQGACRQKEGATEMQWVNNLGTALDHGRRGAGGEMPQLPHPSKGKTPTHDLRVSWRSPALNPQKDEPHLHEHSLFLSTCSSGNLPISISLLTALPATPEITVQINSLHSNPVSGSAYGKNQTQETLQPSFLL